MSEEVKKKGRPPKQGINQWWKTEELAKLFGFDNVRSVQYLSENGIIKPVDKTIDHRRVKRYDLLPTITAVVVYYRNKANGRDRQQSEAELKQQKLLAEIALKESQGELHRLKTDIAAGRYISVEEIKISLTKYFVEFKTYMLTIPARVIGRLAGVVTPVEARRLETELQKEIENQLRQFVSLARKEGSLEAAEEKPEKKASVRPAKTTKKTTAKKTTKKTAAKKAPAKKTVKKTVKKDG